MISAKLTKKELLELLNERWCEFDYCHYCFNPKTGDVIIKFRIGGVKTDDKPMPRCDTPFKLGDD